MILASDVLQQLDEYDDRPMGFPHFGTFYPVDVRLSVYRSDQSWGIIIETLVFDDGPTRHDCIRSLAFCYGSDLPEAPGVRYRQARLTDDGPSGPLFDPADILGHVISPSATDMRVRETIIPVTTDSTAYAQAGIKLRDPPRILGFELLRLVLPRYRRLFFSREGELTDWLGCRMTLFLRLDEWRHPDNEREEKPHDSESFQMIAEVIAANNPNLYCPTERPNTHWKDWPNAGTL
jgi:hypothetical protein